MELPTSSSEFVELIIKDEFSYSDNEMFSCGENEGRVRGGEGKIQKIEAEEGEEETEIPAASKVFVKQEVEESSHSDEERLPSGEREVRGSKGGENEENMSSEEDSPDKQDAFIAIMKEYPCVLKKSLLPAIKNIKKQAIKDIALKYSAFMGKNITEQQVSKKIFNIKERLKKKTYLKAMRNKHIVLKGWEKTVLSLMERETNSSMCRREGVTPAVINNMLRKPEENGNTFSAGTSRRHEPTMVTPVGEKRKRKLIEETEETKHLTNSELQRYVLLEQLQVLKLKKEKLLYEKSLRESAVNGVVVEYDCN